MPDTPEPPTFDRQFDMKGAKHFCRAPFAQPTSPELSFREFANALPKGKPLVEPSALFEEYRGRAVREADRYLFLGLSNYRRALDLLTPSSAYWSWVTMYYSSYYAASAVLGFLGITIEDRHLLIDVLANDPRSQQLMVRKCPKKGPTEQTGGHRLFWDFFYTFGQNVRSDLPLHLRPVVDPIGGKRTWQIKNRNDQNYDTFTAFETCRSFGHDFRRDNFPGSLSADFTIQHTLTTGMLDLSLRLAHDFNVSTDVIDSLRSSGSRREKLEQAIRSARSPFSTNRELFSGPASTRKPLVLHV